MVHRLVPTSETRSSRSSFVASLLRMTARCGVVRCVPAMSLLLEAKDGTEGDAQVIVSAAVEVDEIAELQPQPERAKAGFGAGAGVEGRVEVRVADAEDRAGDAAIGRE